MLSAQQYVRSVKCDVKCFLLPELQSVRHRTLGNYRHHSPRATAVRSGACNGSNDSSSSSSSSSSISSSKEWSFQAGTLVWPKTHRICLFLTDPAQLFQARIYPNAQFYTVRQCVISGRLGGIYKGDMAVCCLPHMKI